MCAAWLNSFSATGSLTPSVFKVVVRQTVIWVCGHLKSRKGGGREGGKEGGKEIERKKHRMQEYSRDCMLMLFDVY